jgi:uncharacterized coiled-coil protein SlyX
MDFTGFDGGDAIQLVVTAVMFLVILPLRNSIENLRESDDKLASELRRSYEKLESRVTNLEVEVAKNYIQRAEVSNSLTELRAALTRIENHLTQRLDKLDDIKEDRRHE